MYVYVCMLLQWLQDGKSFVRLVRRSLFNVVECYSKLGVHGVGIVRGRFRK